MLYRDSRKSACPDFLRFSFDIEIPAYDCFGTFDIGIVFRNAETTFAVDDFAFLLNNFGIYECNRTEFGIFRLFAVFFGFYEIQIAEIYDENAQ